MEHIKTEFTHVAFKATVLREIMDVAQSEKMSLPEIIESLEGIKQILEEIITNSKEQN